MDRYHAEGGQALLAPRDTQMGGTPVSSNPDHSHQPGWTLLGACFHTDTIMTQYTCWEYSLPAASGQARLKPHSANGRPAHK